MNVIINVNQNLARIFLLHAIGTSLALWLFTIVRETADAIAESDSEKYGKKTEQQSRFSFIRFLLSGNLFFIRQERFTLLNRMKHLNLCIMIVVNRMH